MALAFRHKAISLVAGTLAAIIAPPPQLTPTEWAAANLIVPDGPRANERWDITLTPYVREPLDAFATADPTNRTAIRKSAQTGFTTLALAAVGHAIGCDPCHLMIVQPTSDARDDFNRDKLVPAIEETPALRQRVALQTSRSGEGSTSTSKKFRGGRLTLAIASSTADLRSKSIRKLIRDEASDYPADLDGQGSPHDMAARRYESHLVSGEWKDWAISTPTIEGACQITREFEAGDQRYWHICCPGCEEKFFFKFFGGNFTFNDKYPHDAHYVTPCCGSVITGQDKFALVRNAERDGAGWVATAPGPGKSRSYHFDALSSPFVPWDTIAERWIEAQRDPSKLKTFFNLTLGVAFDMKGDAPDHARLMERREDYRRGTIPPRGLMLVGAADVQLRGIYYEIVAYAPNRESWVVDANTIEGDTTDPHRGAFAELAEVYNRHYPDAFGGARAVDAFAVDSGFRSHVVYEFCRTRHNAFAVKGVEGWSRPALGTPSFVDIDMGGKKIAQGTRVWPVGTWSLKGHFYEDLRREGAAAGHEVDPPGYCHFGKFLDDVYFKMITAEFLAEQRDKRGQVRKMWMVRGKEANHFLDCRVYCMALADHLGLSAMTDAEWKMLARERGAPLLEQGELFVARPIAVRFAAAAAAPAPLPQGSARQALEYIRNAGGAPRVDWFDDDHDPIGAKLRRDLCAIGRAVEFEDGSGVLCIKLTDAGAGALAAPAASDPVIRDAGASIDDVAGAAASIDPGVAQPPAPAPAPEAIERQPRELPQAWLRGRGRGWLKRG